MELKPSIARLRRAKNNASEMDACREYHILVKQVLLRPRLPTVYTIKAEEMGQSWTVAHGFDAKTLADTLGDTSDSTPTSLFVNQSISLLLFPVLKQAQHAQQQHHIHRHEAEKGCEDGIEELVGKYTKRSLAGPKPSCHSRACTRLIFDKETRAGISTTFELGLQQ